MAKRGVDGLAFVEFHQFCIGWSIWLSTLQALMIDECISAEAAGGTLLCQLIRDLNT
jgi:hypothetical protein